MKHHISETGIIDLIRNPFAINSWIEQGYGLTPHRSDQLFKILYLPVEDISALPRNEGKYVAYVGIRFGFAIIIKRARKGKAPLSEIINVLNARFGTDFTQSDRLFFDQMEADLILNATIKTQGCVAE